MLAASLGTNFHARRGFPRSLSRLRHLRELVLDDNHALFSDAAAISVGGSVEWPALAGSLQTLSLRSTGLSDLSALEWLEDLTALQSLFLSGNPEQPATAQMCRFPQHLKTLARHNLKKLVLHEKRDTWDSDLDEIPRWTANSLRHIMAFSMASQAQGLRLLV